MNTNVFWDIVWIGAIPGAGLLFNSLVCFLYTGLWLDRVNFAFMLAGLLVFSSSILAHLIYILLPLVVILLLMNLMKESNDQ